MVSPCIVQQKATLGSHAMSQNRNRNGGGIRRDRRDNRNASGAHRPYERYADVVKANPRLEKYYNELLQFPADENNAFWDALKRELPNSFRFCGSKG